MRRFQAGFKTSAAWVGRLRLLASVTALVVAVAPASASVILYDNGPLVNSPGTGAGGDDESVLQTTSLGMTALGFTFDVDDGGGTRLADDFLIPLGLPWQIDSVLIYGYQWGSGTDDSPFDSVSLQIWDGQPGQPSSSVVFGDTTTDRLTGSQFSHIYRVTEQTQGTNDTNRPVWELTVSVGAVLGPGTYWIDFQADDDEDFSEFLVAPPITIDGQATTGDALQFTGSIWDAILDEGTDTPQGIPYKLQGQVIPEPAGVIVWSVLVALGMAVGSRRRKRPAAQAEPTSSLSPPGALANS